MVSASIRSRTFRERKKQEMGVVEYMKTEANRKKLNRQFRRALTQTKHHDPVFIDVKTHMIFRHPFTMVISGPSGCGKTDFVKTLLFNRKQMFDVDFPEIVWHYGIAQKTHDEIRKIAPKIKFIQGLPDEEELAKNVKPKLLILDDLMKETHGDVVGGIFTRRSHHNNFSVIYIVQNLFPNQGKGKGEQRDISLNTKYIVLFKSPRDGLQPIILGTQMGRTKFISEAYRLSTRMAHGYLMLDFTQEVDDRLRVRTRIFPQDPKKIVFTED